MISASVFGYRCPLPTPKKGKSAQQINAKKSANCYEKQKHSRTTYAARDCFCFCFIGVLAAGPPSGRLSTSCFKSDASIKVRLPNLRTGSWPDFISSFWSAKVAVFMSFWVDKR
jgi:hypothetical protein